MVRGYCLAPIVVFLMTDIDRAIVGEDVPKARNIVTKVTVLIDNPLILSTSEQRFHFPDDIQVVGKTSLLCAVLDTTSDSSTTEERHAHYNRLLSKVKLSGWLVLNNGVQVKLERPAYAWASKGFLLEKNELSTCMSISGVDYSELHSASISHAVISATEELKAKGIFWRSTNRFDFRL